MLTPGRLRYLKATLICGAIAAFVSAGLFELGAFRALDAKLATFLGLPAAPTVEHLPQLWFILFFSFGIAWTTVDIARHSLKLFIAAVAFFEVVTAVWVLNLHGRFFTPFASLFAITLAYASGLSYSLTAAGRRKQILRDLLGDRVAPAKFHALLDSNTPANFTGEVREATVVVCEIFNHDALLEKLGTKEYVEMTNAFLRHAADFLVNRGGYLDECDGESLRVLFGVPLTDPEHSIHACEAALELQLRMDDLNRECHTRWGHKLDFRTGINSGEIVLAAYGSRRLGAVSTSGEPVEFARRLCAANTIYGSRILLGSGVFSQAEKTVEVRPMELIQRHRDDPTLEEVYELLAIRGKLTPEETHRRDLFWKGIVFFREQKWDDAMTNFRLAQELFPEDGPSAFYLRRVEQVRAGVASLDWAKT